MDTLNQHNNFIYFTIALVALLLVSAVGHSLPSNTGPVFSEIVTLAMLCIAYYTLRFGRFWRPFVGVILALNLLTIALEGLTQWPGAELASHMISLLFFVGATLSCSRQVLLAAELETNVIVGTLAIYMLLGVTWATLYLIILYFYPQAFHGIVDAPGSGDSSKVLYFSFVTLATLGYGDISPALPIAKSLAYLEAITGTFFLAIVVASLIGGIGRNSDNNSSVK